MADANVSTRVCGACKIELPIEMFTLRSKDGTRRHSQCKTCSAQSQKAWRDANKERQSAKWMEWVRAHPEQFAATQKRYRTKNADKVKAYNVAYAALNREAIIERSRAGYAVRKEQHKAIVYDWRRRNPEAYRAVGTNYRARKRAAEGSHTAEDIKRLHELQRGRCAYCTKKLGAKYHVDHVMPLKLGGANGKENLQLLCPSCNTSKQADDPIDYANRRLGKLF